MSQWSDDALRSLAVLDDAFAVRCGRCRTTIVVVTERFKQMTIRDLEAELRDNGAAALKNPLGPPLWVCKSCQP